MLKNKAFFLFEPNKPLCSIVKYKKKFIKKVCMKLLNRTTE